MKTTVTRKVTEEIEISHVEIEIPMDEITEHEPAIPELIANGFVARDRAHRSEDVWRIRVNIETGQIEGWLDGVAAFDLYVKPVDSGTYRLFAPDGKQVAAMEGAYVPTGLIPGDDGDYIDLKINTAGIITNWPKDPDVSQFFKDSDDD